MPESIDHQHRVDAEQLSMVLSRIEAKPRGLDSRRLLDLAQFCAIIGGALWAFFEFQSFRKENSALTLEQQRFAVQQQAISKQQQALALEMADVTLSYQKKQDALSGLTLSRAKEARRKFESEMTVQLISQDEKEALFDVTISFTVTNTSDQSFTLAYSVIELYVSDPFAMLSTGIDGVLVPSAPAITDTPADETDVSSLPPRVKWKFVIGDAHLYQGLPVDRFPIIQQRYPKPIGGGGGTIKLMAGETTYGAMTFLLRSNPKSWVGSVVNIGYEDGKFDFLKDTQPLIKVQK